MSNIDALSVHLAGGVNVVVKAVTSEVVVLVAIVAEDMIASVWLA